MRVAMLAMDANLDDVSVSLIHTAMLARSLQKKMRVHTLVSSKKKKVETVEGVRIEGVGFEHKHGMAPSLMRLYYQIFFQKLERRRFFTNAQS